MSWASKLKQVFFNLVSKPISAKENWEQVSTLLLQADFGPLFCERLMDSLRERLHQRASIEELLDQLKLVLAKELNYPFEFNQAETSPSVYLFVGVNGSGKTTSVAKTAYFLKHGGRNSLLVCADTFRPAAREQLQIWAERLKLPFLGHQSGGDPSAVVFDALEMALSRKIDAVLLDTAGRQHTLHNLMDELKKIKRIIGKRLPSAPQESLLVLDTNSGLNALSQARSFHEALELTGVILSKFDSSAKGGFILPIRDELKLPVKFLGIGEKVEDLLPFRGEFFLQKLLS